jgi:uncharacterized protein YjbI with pentapeptide repeats/beta-lactamase regulating signal transducer with metallopeptidase domain
MRSRDVIEWHQGFVTLASALSAIALNALWQDALLVTFVWLLLRAWPAINAATRYIVWSATLIAAFVVPVATTLAFFSPASVAAMPPMHTSHQALLKPPSVVARSEALPTHPHASPAATLGTQRLRVTLPLPVAFAVFGLWLVLAGYSLVRLALGLLRLEQLKRDALPLPVEYRDAMPQWLRASKGNRDVRLCVSDETDVPVAVGLFDAMILVPQSLLERLSEPEVDQICLHELAHLRRADDWTNGLQRIVSALLAWNPAVQFIGQQLDLEREVACDDWVLSFVGKVRPYALCLTKMAENASWPRHPIPAPGVFATRKHISLRIERLLAAGRNMATGLAFAPAAGAMVVVAAIAFAIVLVAPSVAASSIAVPAVPAAAPSQRPVQVTKTTSVPRVATTIRSAPTPTVFPSRENGHAQLPPASVKLAPATLKPPSTSLTVTHTNLNVPASGLDAKHLRDTISQSIAAGFNRGFGGTTVAQAKTCVGCDYSGVNWPGRDLRNVNYNGVDFSKANLTGVNFAGSSMNGADFSRANLDGASFRNAHLTGCDFSDANLEGADFTNAWMSGCQFTRARLGSSQLRDVLSGCKGCDFSRGDLAGLDLHGVRTNGDDFSGADLRNVNFAGAELVGTDFSNAKLDGANLAGATLNGCDLSGVDLRRVDLSKTKLIGTDLRNQ